MLDIHTTTIHTSQEDRYIQTHTKKKRNSMTLLEDKTTFTSEGWSHSNHGIHIEQGCSINRLQSDGTTMCRANLITKNSSDNVDAELNLVQA